MVVNPYEEIPELFNPAIIAAYHKNIIDPKPMPPHIFVVASNAYRAIFETEKN